MYSNLYYTSSYLLTHEDQEKKSIRKTFPYFIARFIFVKIKKSFFFVRSYHFLMCFLSKFGASIWEFIWSNKRLLREELFFFYFEIVSIKSVHSAHYNVYGIHTYMVHINTQGGSYPTHRSKSLGIAVWLWHMCEVTFCSGVYMGKIRKNIKKDLCERKTFMEKVFC